MTFHPIVYIAARQPQLLAAHAKAYGDLLLEEGRRAVSSLVVHAVLYAASGFLGLLAVLLGGVSLLLYAAIPGVLREGWVLVGLPGGSFLLAVTCFVAARLLPVDVNLRVMGQQFKADLDMIHEAGQP